MESTRVVMTEEVRVPSGGGHMVLAAGGYYLLPDNVADPLLAAEKAYPDGSPPSASDGTTFEGPGAFASVREHEAHLAAIAREKAGPLEGIEFASDAAAKLAAESGLSATDFKSEAAGSNGYTVAEVRALIGQEE